MYDCECTIVAALSFLTRHATHHSARVSGLLARLVFLKSTIGVARIVVSWFTRTTEAVVGSVETVLLADKEQSVEVRSAKLRLHWFRQTSDTCKQGRWRRGVVRVQARQGGGRGGGGTGRSDERLRERRETDVNSIVLGP